MKESADAGKTSSDSTIVPGFYHATEDGNPDLSNPMTKSEVIELYWATQEDDPSSASSLYLDFHQFDTIEFHIFSDRLSSAILVYRSTRAQLESMREKLLQVKQSGKHRVPGWEGESDMVMDENLGILEDSYIIAAGAATVTAVAALEALLIDLAPDSNGAPSGLHALLTRFLDVHGGKLSRSNRKSIIGKELKIGKRRNQFAHALTGSYFDQSNTSAHMFTEEALEETFYLVASLAIEIERLQRSN